MRNVRSAVLIVGAVVATLTAAGAPPAIAAVPAGAPPAAPAALVAAAADEPPVPAVVAEVALVVAEPEVASAATSPGAEPTPDPVVPTDEPIVADADAGAGRVSTPPVDAAGTQTVGITWSVDVGAGTLAPAVRTLADGEWSQWTDLPVSDEAPDPGTVDADRQLRAGTDAVWVGDVDAVQVSFTAGEQAPSDLRLALVGDDPRGTVEDAQPDLEPAGPGSVTAAVASGARAGAMSASPVAAAVAGPSIVGRAQWGARAAVCAPDVVPALVGAVVHHTATSNGYDSQAAAMQQLRNIQAYHIDGRGWCDVGYNFLVDKWGTIYEGRVGSVSTAVVGVHAGGFNTGTVGVSMLGDYSTSAPSAATQDAVGRIIGWRLGAYGVDPRGSMTYYTGNGDNSRFTNQNVNLPRVFAHRDTAFTACPGNGGYAGMGTIRAVAGDSAQTQRVADIRPIVKKLYKDLLNRDVDAEGLAFYTATIAGGRAPSDVATALATSPEYAYATVARDYQAVLRRGPDPEGTATWSDAIIRGLMRSEDLRIWLFGSREYYNRSGETDAAFVAALYRDVLGREASSGDVAFWAPLVASNGRDAVVRGFWKSGESGNVRVQQAYQHFLGRAADPAGMTTWPPVLLSRGEGELRSQLVNSLEYRNIAHAAY